MKVIGIIPARYASTRFPGKPLVEIEGKSMIQRVYEQASKCERFTKVIVATDDERIFEHVSGFGGEVMMTSESHQSGTDRCAEVQEKLEEELDVIVNIQGDEPFINPEQINSLINLFNADCEIGTLIKKIRTEEELFDRNIPKVVISSNNNAIYFSRSTIPAFKSLEEKEWLNNGVYYKHIGLYAYRSDILKKISSLELSDLEKIESLEQLRWLENGYKIKVAETEFESLAIDTPDDLLKIKEH